MSEDSTGKRVALVVNDLTEGEVEIAAGVLDYSQHQRRWRFTAGNARPFAHINQIKLDRAEGILGGFWQQEWIHRIVELGIPTVNMSNSLADDPLPRVGSDDVAIGRLAAEHLLAAGFVHLAFVPPPVSSGTSDRQLDGFRQAVEQPPDRPCPVFDGYDAEDAPAADHHILDWLSSLPKPVGVFTARDDVASWVIGRCIHLGLRVPQDVAVIASGNNPWVSACSEVSITSVAPDYRAVGYHAAKLLDRLMDGEPAPPPRYIPPLGVVTRASTDIVVQSDPLVTDALKYIREHFADDLSVEEVLDHLGVSRRSLETRLKKAVGHTPQIAIHAAQVEHAKKMLAASRESMGEIAKACGFSLQPRFNRVFKKITGMTPGAYREQHVRRG